jgi:hypothetical protein
MHAEDIEQTRVGTLFGVPAHLYRQALDDLIRWAAAKATRRHDRAFDHELRLRFFSGFFRTRRREFGQRPVYERLGELRRLLPDALRRRRPVAGGQ